MTGFHIAQEYLNFKEVEDKEDLMAFFKIYSIDKDILIDPSKIAWCAAFVNACERAAGNPGTGKLNARSFTTYGWKRNYSQDWTQGDIVVFKRGNSSWQGHVTYLAYVHPDGKNVVCLGGNQGDEVNYSKYPISDILAVRKPNANS